jgi:thiol:disulfide interchange protein DsbD
LNRIAAVNRGGLSGALFMGLSMGILAAPCLGPFVLGLMAHVAGDGRLFYGALLFLVFSLGLGLPLTVLAFFSGAIHRLPGAGEWMVWVRKLFGLILLLMAIYVAIPLLSDLAFFLLVTTSGIAGGIYLGLEKSGGSNFMKFKKVVGLVIVVAALGFACQQAPYLDDRGEGGDSALLWTPFSQTALAQAKTKGQPALLDFTAAWCQPCREMERRTFPHPGVRQLLSQFALLKVDVTNGPTNNDARQIINRYRIRGVPCYLFVNSQGRVMVRYTLVGFVEPEQFIAHLQAVLKAAGG